MPGNPEGPGAVPVAAPGRPRPPAPGAGTHAGVHPLPQHRRPLPRPPHPGTAGARRRAAAAARRLLRAPARVRRRRRLGQAALPPPAQRSARAVRRAPRPQPTPARAPTRSIPPLLAVKSTLPPLLRHERGGYVGRQRQEDHAQRSHTRPGSAAAGPTDSAIGSLSRVILANRFTFHHLVGELLGKRALLAVWGDPTATPLRKPYNRSPFRLPRSARKLHTFRPCPFRRPSMAGRRRPRADTPLHHKHGAEAGDDRAQQSACSGRQSRKRASSWRWREPCLDAWTTAG